MGRQAVVISGNEAFVSNTVYMLSLVDKITNINKYLRDPGGGGGFVVLSTIPFP